VVVDQLGSFPAMATVGTAAAFWFAARAGADTEKMSFSTPSPTKRGNNALLESTGRSHPPALGLALNRLLRFPPFWATILALITRPWDYPAWLSTGLSRLAQMLVPLALVSVGYQTRLHPTVLRRVAQPLAWGLGFKLAFFPLLCALAARAALSGPPSYEAQIILLEAAMAPMITSGVLAEEAGLDAEVARAMVSVGILLSLVSVPSWSWALA
jgi:predicted permease